MKEKETERLKKLKEFESKLYDNKIKYIAGIDEAGRGPLAGPVVVGCVIMNPESFIEYINDSKKISETKREILYQKIKEEAIDFSVGIVEQEEIDKINILNATKKALTIAIDKLNVKPDIILVDALDKIDTKGIPYISVIKGDAKIYSVSAASIIAKVTRDRIMREYDEVYPEYGFKKHKGYGTAMHIQAIKEHGICDLHRKTFVKNFI
ncbi:MAG: ribonuclease HII [Clostridia bacterium]|nr:ribonuclease HII [Clostridia bacterium]